MQVAEEIRSNIRALQIVHISFQVSRYVTLSLEVASTIPSNESSSKVLIAVADRVLYQVKD